MSAAAIIYLVISGIGLLVAANKHGEPRDNYNFWDAFLGTAIAIGLLLWGGFFHVG